MGGGSVLPCQDCERHSETWGAVAEVEDVVETTCPEPRRVVGSVCCMGCEGDNLINTRGDFVSTNSNGVGRRGPCDIDQEAGTGLITGGEGPDLNLWSI